MSGQVEMNEYTIRKNKTNDIWRLGKIHTILSTENILDTTEITKLLRDLSPKTSVIIKNNGVSIKGLSNVAYLESNKEAIKFMAIGLIMEYSKEYDEKVLNLRKQVVNLYALRNNINNQESKLRLMHSMVYRNLGNSNLGLYSESDEYILKCIDAELSNNKKLVDKQIENRVRAIRERYIHRT